MCLNICNIIDTNEESCKFSNLTGPPAPSEHMGNVHPLYVYIEELCEWVILCFHADKFL